jgi:hypothetical protein
MFDGTLVLSQEDIFNWSYKQKQRHFRVNRLLKGEKERSWITPDFLKQSICYITRLIEKDSRTSHQNLFVFNTIEDHRKDLIDFCTHHEFDGIFTDDLELIALYSLKSSENNSTLRKPIFSAKSFKLLLQNKGVEAKRYKLDSILQHLNLDFEQFGWFTVLLGSYWFPYEWLASFYKKLVPSCFNTNFEDIYVI